MPSCDEVGDGPTILQLQKWGNESRFQLELSDYCEASISPTRQLLLLLSHQCEALLVPLIAGNGSIPTNKDESNMLYHEAVQEPRSLTYSPEQATLCKLDSSSDAPCGSKPGVNGSSTVNKFPVLSDVKSFSWGHCGDAYSHFMGSGFSDILVVSGDNGITVHAFRHLDKSKCGMKSSPEGASLHGNWVEWGPNHCTYAKEQLSNPDIHINLCNIDSVNRTVGEQHVDGEFKDVGPSNSSSTQKKWLQTFLTEVETVLSSGKCSTRFPAESSFPHSAAVVSFSIYDSILKFFQFFSCTGPKSFGVDQNEENTPTFGLPSRVPLHFHSKDDYTGISYKCSRVFSSPSCTLLGLVLNISNTASINSDDDHSSKVLVVVVVVVYDWGLQWLCSVELDKHYPGPGPNPEWADFQFSGNFLVCLTVSGLVGIWGAESGHFVAHVDVLRCSGLDSRILSRCDRPELSRTEDSDSKVGSSGKADIKSESDGSETCSRDLVSVRTFRKLMVASHSLLLAVIDEIGIIYVIRTDDYISEKKYKFNSFMPPSDFGTMMGWKLAGSEIVGPKVFADFSSGQVQVLDTNYIRDAEFEKSKPCIKHKEAKLDMYSSDFTTYSQVKGWNISHSISEVSSAPMRRIFLPPEKYNKEDCICFSPFGITRFIKTRNLEERKSYKIVHTGLFVAHSAFDERDTYECFMSTSGSTKGTVFVGESIGCSFQGCLYIVTQDGLSVILPSVSVSSRAPPVETIRYWQPTAVDGSKYQVKDLLEVNQHKDLWRPWQVEVLDKVLLYEGPNEAECICLKNGWDFKFARVRRMQLALHYLKIDEIEQSLNMLVDVNLAEEGILRLLFTTVYQISCKVGVENEVALASRLLALAACFATKMIHSYGLANHKNDKLILSVPKDIGVSYLRPFFPNHLVEISSSKRLNEMAYFLEVIRNLQSRLATKSRRPGKQVFADGRDQMEIFDPEVSHEDTSLPIVTLDSVLSGMQDASEFVTKGESASTATQLSFDNTESLALTLTESSDMVDLHEFYGHETSPSHMRKLISLENTRDMIARWQADNLDLKSVVKDALHSGRLPLAVLQLHLQRQRELVSENEYQDIFNEVHDAGRAIAYDLFLKGESGLAMATLQRLGEDIEIVLRQLLFGTVRRSLRAQLQAEMRAYGWLRSHELKILDRISLIERLYPSSSFWGTFLARRKNIDETALICTLPEANNLKVAFNVYDNLIIECGDIDGVVIGVWTNDIGCSSSSSSLCDESDDNNQTIYWACAAVWSDAWDERTMDRILLDQPFHTGVHLAWESQLEYHTSRNDLAEVYKLLDVIPTTSLSMGTLRINLKPPHSSANVGTSLNFPDYQMYICAAEDLEPVCMDIPNVKIFKSSAVHTCSSSLKMLLEQELARKYIFLKEYWDSTDEIIALLARAGSIIDTSKLSVRAESSKSSLYLDTFKISELSDKVNEEAVHKVVVRHCIQNNLPNLLDLYIDHHNLVLDNDSLCSLLEAAGDCQWAKWLFYSRVKGREYEASFSNARSNLSRQMTLGSNLSEIDEIIYTVDDMAEGGGEMAALATLAYATEPMQKCLCSGSVNRHCSASSQCTLENLRPALQHFPTLWRTLVATCFGHDASVYSFGPSSSNVLGRSTVTDYVNWRYSVLRSAGSDTSLIQMLPGWFPKSIRRLIKLFVQGPLGWQSLSGEETSGESFIYSRNNYAFHAGGDVGVSAMSWEATIEKSVKELYSSLKENGVGIEHHLHRGRPLAAFNHLLGVRALKLKSMNAQVSAGQSNMQSDVQTMFAPLTRTEGLLLSSVMPLAILHFEDSVLVSSCAFLLELCGLSASILRVDIAALRRISYYYNLVEQNAHSEHVPTKGSVFHALSQKGDFAISLAGALADDYVQSDHLNSLEHIDVPDKISTGKQPSRALLTVLLHLEKASLPSIDAGRSCGSWLSSGDGDGFDFRSQQKDASQQWSLVTTFCQIHCLPLSTKYLALLANGNDWVGFLTEAQLGGFPIHVIIQVAAQEFKDPRLKTHVLTVLKNMQSTRKKTSSSSSSSGRNEILFVTDSNPLVPTELFGILAECERQKNPGEALLVKAKYLSWSLLAMIASCFPDVSPLSCLTVWLEITAARETSSIHVNDISSRITNNVGAAVDATNTLPTGSRPFTFHYNRRNSKRRRIMEPSTTVPFSNFPSPVSSAVVPFAQEIASEEERKKIIHEQLKISSDSDEGLASLSNMVAVLCEQHLFLPLLRAFEMFLPSCSLLPFIRSLQAFSQMRLSEASAHLASFSARIREEPFLMQLNMAKNGQIKTAWISSTAVKAADAMLSTCPSAYEKRCLLQLLSAADFGDGGSASTYFRRLYWKINLAEPSLRKDDDVYLGNETLDDASLLSALEKNGHWEQARNWARQLESTSASWKSVVHHVTETQAESMVTEWKEFLWDIPEERAALWIHCQTLFQRHSFPALQAGLFFLKHAEAIEKEIPARELHEMLLFSLQWLSGTMTQSDPVCPLNLLREIETRVWLLAVESEAQSKAEGDFTLADSVQNRAGGNNNSFIEQTAGIIAKMDNHMHAMRMRSTEKNFPRENNLLQQRYSQPSDSNSQAISASSTRTKRRTKNYMPLRRHIPDNVDINNDSDDNPNSPNTKIVNESSKNSHFQEENIKIGASLSGWEEKMRPAELERAVLSLLEFGQITAAKQLQHKLSPEHVPSELVIVDAALKLAALSSSSSSGEISVSMLEPKVLSIIESLDILSCNQHIVDVLQVLESLTDKFGQGCGRGLCRRIISVVKAAKVLGLLFSEAFEKKPIELLQLLSLKAQDSLEEAKLLVKTHVLPPSAIARILAESFLKGLLAAHRGGYIDSQKEEGPAPLLWRFSDFLMWAELCPSEPEIGHALMRLVMTGQDIPHACEVELLILSHHFYKSSACLDGVDVLVTLAANRVESYVLEGDFSCLARLVTGVGNFHALNFIINILIENGQLQLLLQKYSSDDASTNTAEAVRGFRMAVLTSLKLFNPYDLDAFAMVYNHFDMKHETASLLESRSTLYIQQWLSRRDKDRQNEDLLEAMRHLIEVAEVLSTIDAGHKTHRACSRASLLSLQIRIPDLNWLELSETNARRAFVEQSRFQEALIVAEAYNLNQPSEWAPVLWNLMLKPDLIEQFVAEFVAVLPLQPSMLLELARFYRSEVAARGDQSHFSVWLSPGGLPAEWVKHLGRSFRCLLRRTRDLRVRVQLATIATGFFDVVDACSKVLDKVPDNAGPLLLRRGHGGAYLPLM